MINVLLAEDHNLVRNGIKSLLDSEPNINVIGEAANGTQAVQFLQKTNEVNLIVADYNMPGMTGGELITQLRLNFKDLKIIILSMSDQEKHVFESISCGANGYLLKNVSKDELIFAIKHVMTGEKYICSELSLRMFDKLSNHAAINLDGINDFTKRELEVLKLIASGLTNNEIAEKLFTSRRTVEGHRQSLIDKTKVPNSAALIMFAFRTGIIN
ncbi:MAG: response regulator transcription factor [Flavobacterium sp.]|nr:response regulator transcription factor [Pedobacter sp.]